MKLILGKFNIKEEIISKAVGLAHTHSSTYISLFSFHEHTKATSSTIVAKTTIWISNFKERDMTLSFTLSETFHGEGLN